MQMTFDANDAEWISTSLRCLFDRYDIDEVQQYGFIASVNAVFFRGC